MIKRVSVLVLALMLFFNTSVHASHMDISTQCNMKHGPDKVTIGAIYYFATVMEDTARVLELPPGSDWDVELYNDFLCWVPRASQPVLISTAENLIYLALEVIPAIAKNT
jgi:hypothetical protein